jgi:hypothetical protein
LRGRAWEVPAREDSLGEGVGFVPVRSEGRVSGFVGEVWGWERVTLEEVEDGSVGGSDEEDSPWVWDVHLYGS